MLITTAPTLTKREVVAELSLHLAALELKSVEETRQLDDLVANNVEIQSQVEVPTHEM